MSMFVELISGGVREKNCTVFAKTQILAGIPPMLRMIVLPKMVVLYVLEHVAFCFEWILHKIVVPHTFPMKH